MSTGQIHEDIARVAKTVDTFPTDAQVATKNYDKGHVQLHGMHVFLENRCGSTRSVIDIDNLAGHLISRPPG